MAKLTLEAIAKLAGVSRSTVSRVVRNQPGVDRAVRARIQKVIHETGYRPNPAAQMLAGQRTNIIGLVFCEPVEALFQNTFFSHLILGITEAADAQKQMLTLFLFREWASVSQFSERILQNPMIDGFIVSGMRMNDPHLDTLLASGTPFVHLGRTENSAINFVEFENESGAEQAVEHFIQLGYQRIGTITGDMMLHASRDRLAGYQNALLRHGHIPEPALVVEGDFGEDSGYDGMKQLLGQHVDAVFTGSDHTAMGAIRAVQEAGLSVPEDIAIIGFDDLDEAAIQRPALTTVRQPIMDSGREAVKLLLNHVIPELSGNSADEETLSSTARKIFLPTELIVRDSCGATIRR